MMKIDSIVYREPLHRRLFFVRSWPQVFFLLVLVLVMALISHVIHVNRYEAIGIIIGAVIGALPSFMHVMSAEFRVRNISNNIQSLEQILTRLKWKRIENPDAKIEFSYSDFRFLFKEKHFIEIDSINNELVVIGPYIYLKALRRLLFRVSN